MTVPVITSVSPSSGLGGTIVEVHASGGGFTAFAPTAVYFGSVLAPPSTFGGLNIPAVEVFVINDGLLMANAPSVIYPAQGVCDITVVGTGGTTSIVAADEFNLKGAFPPYVCYLGGPVVYSSVSPFQTVGNVETGGSSKLANPSGIAIPPLIVVDVVGTVVADKESNSFGLPPQGVAYYGSDFSQEALRRFVENYLLGSFLGTNAAGSGVGLNLVNLTANGIQFVWVG